MRTRRVSGVAMAGLLALVAACAHRDVTVSPVEPAAGGTPIQVGTWWQTTNPGGGGVLASPVVSPDGTWAVATDISGLALSFDEGATWQRIGAAQGLTVTHVSTLLALADGRFLAGSGEGLWMVSSDGSRVEPLPGLPADEYVSALAAGPAGAPLWAATHGDFDGLAPEVYRSDDGGVSWTSVALLPAAARVTALRTHPDDPAMVLALSGWSRFTADGIPAAWLSRDGGASWQPVAPEDAEVVDAAIDPHRPSLVWFTDAAGRLWRVVDGGSPAPVADHGGLLWLDPAEPGHLRLVEPGSTGPGDRGAAEPIGAVWDSPNDGITWIQRSEEGAWNAGWSAAPWRFDISPQGVGQTLAMSGPTLLWATSQGLLVSVDGGRTVDTGLSTLTEQATFSSRGLDNVTAFDVVVAPGNPDVVYGGYSDLGCWRSVDGGDSWSGCNQADLTGTWAGHGGNVTALAVDPIRADHVWAAMGGDLSLGQQVVHSREGGQPGTWTVASGLAEGATVTDLVVGPQGEPGDRVVWAAVDGDVYRSTDSGGSFDLVHPCSGCRGVWLGDGFVLAGGETGLWVSRDGLADWRLVPVGTSGAVAGPPWTRDWVGIAGVAIDPADPDRWWVAITGEGLFTTGDGGATWAQVTVDRWIRDVLTPGDGSVWTASSSATLAGGFASDSRGVLVSPDGGLTWSQHVESLAWPFALRLAQVPGGPMWIATAGEGLARRRDDPPPTGGGFIG